MTARSPADLCTVRDEITTYLSRASHLALPLVSVAGSRSRPLADPSRSAIVPSVSFGHQIDPDAVPELSAELLGASRLAELFFVSAAMGQFVLSAAQSLEETPLDQTDFLAPHGLIYFEDGLASKVRQPMGLLWSARAIDCTVAWLDSLEQVPTVEDRRLIAEGWGCYPHLFVRYAWQGTYEEIGGVVGGTSLPDAPINMLAELLTVFYLMRQRLIISAEPDLTRSERKRAARSEIDLAKTRVIKLRTVHRETDGDGPGRDYQHQWVVRGHWRRQWYPTDQVHRPVWIAPHIKGPEGAPLLGTSKVYSLQR